MNRYVVAGIAKDVSVGLNVVAVLRTQTEAREAIRAVAVRLEADNVLYKESLVNGNEWVESIAGAVFTTQVSERGEHLDDVLSDVVYLGIGLDDRVDWVSKARYAVVGSDRAEVIRA